MTDEFFATLSRKCQLDILIALCDELGVIEKLAANSMDLDEKSCHFADWQYLNGVRKNLEKIADSSHENVPLARQKRPAKKACQ